MKFLFFPIEMATVCGSHKMALNFCRRSTYNHLSSWLTDARNLTNPNTVS